MKALFIDIFFTFDVLCAILSHAHLLHILLFYMHSLKYKVTYSLMALFQANLYRVYLYLKF